MLRWFKKLVGTSAIGATIAVLIVASGAAASAGQLRVGAAPARPAGSALVGALASSTPMRVTVVLKPRDPAGLQAFATAVSTPGSPEYRQFLSVAQFRQRFGPTDAQIAAVAASLRAHGLNPGAVSANGLAIPVTATAGAVGAAFHTSLERVALHSGRTAFVNAQAPLLDASVAGYVQNVLGLDDLAVAHPLGLRHSLSAARGAGPRNVKHVATGGPQPCPTAASVAASATAFGIISYTTDQLASAYSFSGLYGAGNEGAGQTIALYELEGNFPSDITAYESCYGISAPVSYTQVDGGPPAPNANNSDGFETELDIEQAIGFAPKAHVLVYQGPNSNSNLPGAGPYDVYNAIISQDKAQVISTSWGVCEPQDTPAPAAQEAENTLFQEAAVQGQSVFNAAGDSGSEGCTDPNTGDPLPGLAAGDPASQPFVTGVGGTTLVVGPPRAEGVWNDPASSLDCFDFLGNPTACGGGGGLSDLWRMPSYQSGAPSTLNVINSHSSGTPCNAPAGSYCRETPDVSADADTATGITIYWNGNGTPTYSNLNSNPPGGWIPGVGGTSAGAPLWAALIADANSSSACNGTPIGFANPVLYGSAASGYSQYFNDITFGNNDVLGTNGGLYPAGPGYDMASGLGTPNAAALAVNLCAPAIGVSNPGPQTSMLHSTATLQIAASDSSGRPLTFSATGLPPGLSINSSTGAITGNLSSAGAYAVTVRATNTRGNFGSASFSWTVQGPPSGSKGSLTGVANGNPKLALTLAAGTAAPALRKIVITLPKGLSFNRKHLKSWVSVNGSHRLSFKLKGRTLTITLKSAVTKAHVTIVSPALSVTRHYKKFTLIVQAIDATGHATTIQLKLRPS
jgi:subtilase family serine protease